MPMLMMPELASGDAEGERNVEKLSHLSHFCLSNERDAAPGAPLWSQHLRRSSSRSKSEAAKLNSASLCVLFLSLLSGFLGADAVTGSTWGDEQRQGPAFCLKAGVRDEAKVLPTQRSSWQPPAIMRSSDRLSQPRHARWFSALVGSSPGAVFRHPSLRTALNLQVRPSSSSSSSTSPPPSSLNSLPESRLNPAPDDYAAPSFADKAELTLYAGRGGNGCVSFQREAYLPDGPPNGGDGGLGGNVYIQAAHGETSLHKLARKRFIRAGRGRHGQGSGKGGMRGEDVVITVPVGTIVQEIERHDPAAEEDVAMKAWQALRKQRRRELLAQQQLEAESGPPQEDVLDDRRSRKSSPEDDYDPDADDPERGKWLLYPGMSKNDIKSAEFPKLPKRTRFFQQPAAPVYLDLSRPTPTPILLATGGIGGLGNPHFTSRSHPRPVFATKGEEAVTIKIALELKLLADVGLVGLPNAGKSTLLRALTNSRTRVGNWAFTTLQPNIGTVVLDKYSGRPSVKARRHRYPASSDFGSSNDASADNSTVGEPRTRFTVADIPGLIEGAHLDRGLGIAFLRHVERAGVLAFVIDLGAGNAVEALQALWREVSLYAEMRQEEERSREIESRVDWDLVSQATRGPVNLMGASYGTPLPMQEAQTRSPTVHIAGKPWFVVATKADLPETQENFRELKAYLDGVTEAREPHPSGVEGAWTKNCAAIPVSAIQGQGVDRIVHWTVGLLDE
ncbi:gtp-binding obg [Trichoderma arundinaceum]|uniref:Gtp-binding obg n=1 Tax=Trichoderma arundinaceum TaxID=490622 RepID=A0A395NPJ1_TRIAR|nr:gtp-binding obg [Trichoderma arundinaceum]